MFSRLDQSACAGRSRPHVRVDPLLPCLRFSVGDPVDLGLRCWPLLVPVDLVLLSAHALSVQQWPCRPPCTASRQADYLSVLGPFWPAGPLGVLWSYWSRPLVGDPGLSVSTSCCTRELCPLVNVYALGFRLRSQFGHHLSISRWCLHG